MHIIKLFWLRMFYLTSIVGLILVYVILLFNTEIDQRILLNRIDCYNFPNYLNEMLNIEVLDDISSAKVKPDDGRSIFFVLTGCSEQGTIVLSASQSCAIESAAYHNPNRTVFVLFASLVGFSPETQSPTLAVLRSYANIHFLNINLDTFVEGTPAEGFYRSGKLFPSKYFMEHMSDFLRLLVLYKYGGIYLDLDAIVQKNLDELPANFLGQEAYRGDKINGVNGAVIGFQDEIGHEILELCLNDLIINFKTNVWSYNGPQLFTRVLENRVCNTRLTKNTPVKCRGLKVFPPAEFYAINFDEWSYFLNERYMEYVLETTKNSFVIHLWNHNFRNKIITKSKTKSRTAYEAIAEMNCPKVFTATGDYF